MPRRTKRNQDQPTAQDAGDGRAFTPFADDASVQNFGDLSIENGIDRIALHGSLDLTRDRAGLDRARRLKALFEAVVAALESEPDLPAEVAETVRAPDTVKNPFA